MSCKVIKGQAYQQSGVILMARLISNAGVYVSQAAISSITCGVYDTASPNQVVASPSVSVASTIYDTLQTNLLWTKDALGYNFKYELPSSALPRGNKTYRVEFRVTPVGGQQYHIVFEIQTERLLSAD